VAALLDRHPEVARAALRFLSGRQRTMQNVVEDLALRDVTARVARLLLGCAGRRPHIVERAETACSRITHKEIASMVGSVREVVQRALKALERDGAIALDRRGLRVLDPAKLEQWAQG
jgi:CRP/FNR family transcriptional regulator